MSVERQLSKHSVRLNTNNLDGLEYGASFTYTEVQFEHGTTHGSMGYCVASAMLSLHSGSAQSLLYDLADAVEFLGDYDPFEHLKITTEQDKAEHDAAWRMIAAGREFAELRNARMRALNAERSKKGGA